MQISILEKKIKEKLQAFIARYRYIRSSLIARTAEFPE
jgi:hypothetical protein